MSGMKDRRIGFPNLLEDKDFIFYSWAMPVITL